MVIHVTFNHSVIGSNPVDPIYNGYYCINIIELYLIIGGGAAHTKPADGFVVCA